MGDYMKKNIIYTSFFLIIMDQIVKYIVATNLNLLESIRVIKNFLYITYVQNDGAAFGILQNGRWGFIVLGMFAIYFIIRYILAIKEISKFDFVSYSFIIAGIIGNLIDRILFGYVIDYIDIYILGYNFPVFNIADMLIVIGFILVMYKEVVGVKNENNNSRRK